jgi:hypothetical protein
MKVIVLFSVFVAMFILALEGSWIEQRADDNYLNYVHQNIFQSFTTWIALPGDIIVTLVMNPTDIPERDPESWAIRWFTAPISAAAWTLILFIILSGFRYVQRRFTHCA